MNDQQRVAMQDAIDCCEDNAPYEAARILREALQEYALQTLSDIHQEMEKPQGEWVDLTDEETDKLATEFNMDLRKEASWLIAAVIAKFKEKNTPPVVPQCDPLITGDTSDGYHTFNELYEFRKAYNAALFNEWAANGKCSVHKSWKHHDGELCFGGGWYIVVAVLPNGQVSNHYEAKDWDLFNVPEAERSLFEFDGHTGSDVIARLKSYTPPVVPQGCSYCNSDLFAGTKCNNCGKVFEAVAGSDDDTDKAAELVWHMQAQLEAMRIETLEKAAKVVEAMFKKGAGFVSEPVAAAIRGMK